MFLDTAAAIASRGCSCISTDTPDASRIRLASPDANSRAAPVCSERILSEYSKNPMELDTMSCTGIQVTLTGLLERMPLPGAPVARSSNSVSPGSATGRWLLATFKLSCN